MGPLIVLQARCGSSGVQICLMCICKDTKIMYDSDSRSDKIVAGRNGVHFTASSNSHEQIHFVNTRILKVYKIKKIFFKRLHYLVLSFSFISLDKAAPIVCAFREILNCPSLQSPWPTPQFLVICVNMKWGMGLFSQCPLFSIEKQQAVA